MIDFHQMVQIVAREISADQRFLNALTGFYMDMKLCPNDSEKLLSAKLLIKEMDRVKNEYLSCYDRKQESVTTGSNIYNLQHAGKGGERESSFGKIVVQDSGKSNDQ